MTPNRRLKQARELRGWSQAKVAEQIGTDATTVSRWERGMFFPTPYFRERLCTLFEKNAEELGLLEAVVDQPLVSDRAFSQLQLPPEFRAFLASNERQRNEAPAGQGDALALSTPPLWPQKGDTFEYIVSSAVHDQQAHMLWEHAYVQALRGQREEAQQLGEASLSAFEHVGHMNASALREWLDQHNLVARSPETEKTPASMATSTARRKKVPSGRRKGIGLSLILMVVIAFAVSGFAFSQWYSSALASRSATSAPLPTTVLSFSTSTSVPGLVPATTKSTQPSSTPVVVPTSPPPTPTSTPTPVPTKILPLDLTVTVSPASLKPYDCVLEASNNNRCTVELTLYSNSSDAFQWLASTNNMPAQFNPSSGTGMKGQTIQVIIYIPNVPGQNGKLVFTFFNASAPTNTYIVSVSWIS